MIRITTAQRLLLADSVRGGLVGWLLTCPVAGQQCRLIRGRAATAAGFSFSRFASAAGAHFGPDFHPYCIGSGRMFPLSVEESCALANDLELELAADDQIRAAALVAAHCPYAQPDVRGPSWRTYTSMLAAAGIDWTQGNPAWKATVADLLRPFRRAVAASRAVAAE